MLHKRKFKVLTHCNQYVDVNLLEKGIYVSSKPFIYGEDETIESIIERAENIKDLNDVLFISDKYFENLKQCELKEIYILDIGDNLGISEIFMERCSQRFEKNYTFELDDKYINNELAIAGACYAIPNYDNNDKIQSELSFPWDNKYWKPSPENRINELKKAGALIAAEIDRLIRLKNK